MHITCIFFASLSTSRYINKQVKICNSPIAYTKGYKFSRLDRSKCRRFAELIFTVERFLANFSEFIFAVFNLFFSGNQEKERVS